MNLEKLLEHFVYLQSFYAFLLIKVLLVFALSSRSSEACSVMFWQRAPAGSPFVDAAREYTFSGP